MKWTYRGKVCDKLEQDVRYFVYIIYYEDNTKYVGCKAVWTERRLKPLKAQRANAKRVALKESNWKSYYGSSDANKGKKPVTREILYLCSNRRTATYLEAKEILSRGAIEDDSYNNLNCLGKFFSNCLDGLITKEI